MELKDEPMAAPQFSVFIATSLDGFIAGPGDDLDFLKAVESPPEDYGYAKFAASVDALLMGRRTYDKVVAMGEWFYGDKPVYVVTNRPGTSTHGEKFVSGTPKELAGQLEGAGHRRVYLDGGNLIRQFLAEGLVTDLTVSLIPVLLGSGIPLFGGTGAPCELSFDSADSYPTGLVQLRYRVKH
jgi:dihydrofolate reductase